MRHKRSGSRVRIFRKSLARLPTARAHRHSRKNSRASRGEAVDDRSRHPIVTERKRNAAHDKRRQQIAKAIGMRNWDDAKVQVALADAHRLANVLAIGQQLFAAKTDRAWRGGGARRELQ